MESSSSSLRRFPHLIDAWQRRQRGISFLVAIIKKYRDDEIGQRAALLTYYAFLSLFPLLLILTTLLDILLRHDPALSNHIIRDLVSYFPLVGRGLENNVHVLHQTGLALIAGILLTLYGTRGVADTLRHILDYIWQVPYHQRARPPAALGRSLLIIIIGGFGLSVAPVLFGYIFAFAPNRLIGGLSTLSTAMLLFGVLVFVIRVGTSQPLPFRRVWISALAAVIGLVVLQSAGSYIMTQQLRHLDTLYGTFALVLGLIFWLYLQAQVLLFAFEIDAVRYFRLWPRSLYPPLTPADHVAYQLYHDRARFHDQQV